MANLYQILLLLFMFCAESRSESKKISQWSYSRCSKSQTQMSHINFTTKLPSLWYGYDVAVRVIPSDPTVDHEFNATVTEIKIKNNVAIVELNRTDQNMGWDQMPITVIVTETGYDDIIDYIRRTASVHYNLDEGNYVTNSTSNRVSGLIDKGLSKLPALQSNPDRQPTLSSDDHNGRKYLIFNGTNQVLLVPGLDIDTVSMLSVTIVYRIDGYDDTYSISKNGLFGNAITNHNKYVYVQKDDKIVISGTTSEYVAANARINNVKAAAINVWNILTVQWDVDGGMDASSVWCNGQLLERFQARPVLSVPSTFNIGDTNTKTNLPFKGAIGEFLTYRGQVLSDEMITDHHRYFMDRWAISS